MLSGSIELCCSCRSIETLLNFRGGNNKTGRHISKARDLRGHTARDIAVALNNESVIRLLDLQQDQQQRVAVHIPAEYHTLRRVHPAASPHLRYGPVSPEATAIEVRARHNSKPQRVETDWKEQLTTIRTSDLDHFKRADTYSGHNTSNQSRQQAVLETTTSLLRGFQHALSEVERKAWGTRKVDNTRPMLTQHNQVHPEPMLGHDLLHEDAHMHSHGKATLDLSTALATPVLNKPTRAVSGGMASNNNGESQRKWSYRCAQL